MAGSTETKEAVPQVGDMAPDVELVDVEGASVQLSTLWRERPVVLVFLRHLACTFCQQQIAWLRRDIEKFKAAGVDVVVVSEGTAKVGKAYSLLYALPFPLLLCGDDLAVYRRYGLLRGVGMWVLRPRVLWRGLISYLQGFVQKKIEGDTKQFGGGFVIDRAGYIRYLYRSVDGSDVVPTKGLLDAATKLSG
jgi:peroxiredoxin